MVAPPTTDSLNHVEFFRISQSMKKSAVEHARDLLWLDDLDGASRVAEDEICRFGDKGNTAEIWQFRFIRSEIIRLRGHTEEALRYLESQESVNLPDTSDIDSLARLWMHRGYCYGLLGRHELSLRLLAAAEETARDSGLFELLCEVHQRQAMILFRQQDYGASDRIFRIILKLSDEMEGWYFQGNARWGIGKNLMIQRHYREAMPWLKDSLKIFEDVNARLSVATVWGELAVCYLGLGDDEKALELFQKAAER